MIHRYPRLKHISWHVIFYCLLFAYLLYLQWGVGFADPDSFYHAKIGELMSRGQLIIKQFPWFSFTTFNSRFTDHQFLYHLFLTPLNFFLSPLAATKTLAVVMAFSFFALFDWILKKEALQFRLLYSIALVIAFPFVFRLNLAKAGSLALILLFVGAHALWHKKYILLGILTFLYVWTHAGWLSMGVMYITWFASEMFVSQAAAIQHKSLSTQIVHALYKDRGLWAITAGMIAGILINPYFPQNLIFYWQQAVQIGLVNYQSQVNVGMEWYPFPLSALAKQLISIWMLLLIAFILFIACIFKGAPPTFTKQMRGLSARTLHMTMFAGLWFVLTIKSARYVEYLAPSAVLAAAFLFELTREMNGLTAIKTHLRRHKMMYKIIGCACLIFFTGTYAYKARAMREDISSALPWRRLQASSKYLAANTPKDTLVFHTNWSDAPLLFFNNTHNRYVAGLDPTFFYLADAALYRRWIDISMGAVHMPARAIYDTFRTPYILVILPQDWRLNYELRKGPRTRAVFHDDVSIVYRFTP